MVDRFGTISIRKSAAMFMATLLFFDALLVPLVEANFWQERRAAVASRPDPSEQPAIPVIQTASLVPPFTVPPAPIAIEVLPSENLRESMRQRFPAKIATGLPAWAARAPAKFGDVQDVYLTPNHTGKFVVLIQDAHGIESAQRNIAGLLNSLDEVYRSEHAGKRLLIGIEGAAGKFSLAPCRQYDDAQIQSEASDALLKGKFISGPEYFGITAKAIPLLWGVETPSLYLANVEAYRQGLKLKPGLDRTLTKASARVTRIKERLLPPALLAMDDTLAAYESGKLDPAKFIVSLSHMDASMLDGLPEVARLQEVIAAERALDFKQVELERGRFVEALAGALSADEVQQLIGQSAAYKAGQLSYQSYYGFLENAAARKHLSLDSYPAFKSYIRYALKSEKIDKYALFEEIEQLKRRAVDHSARTAKDREVLQLSADLRFLRRMLERDLSEAEWSVYENAEARFDDLSHRIETYSGQAGLDRPSRKEAIHEKDVRALGDFYRIAVERNRAMLANLQSEMRDLGSQNAVIVAGGFHTSGLGALLRRVGISYVVLSPKVGEINENPKQYLDVFAVNRSPLDKMLLGERLNLNVPAALVQRNFPGFADRTYRAAVAKLAADTTLTFRRSLSIQAAQRRAKKVMELLAGFLPEVPRNTAVNNGIGTLYFNGGRRFVMKSTFTGEKPRSGGFDVPLPGGSVQISPQISGELIYTGISSGWKIFKQRVELSWDSKFFRYGVRPFVENIIFSSLWIFKNHPSVGIPLMIFYAAVFAAVHHWGPMASRTVASRAPPKFLGKHAVFLARLAGSLIIASLIYLPAELNSTFNFLPLHAILPLSFFAAFVYHSPIHNRFLFPWAPLVLAQKTPPEVETPGYKAKRLADWVSWMESNLQGYEHGSPKIQRAKDFAETMLSWDGSTDAIAAALLTDIENEENLPAILIGFDIDAQEWRRVVKLTRSLRYYQGLPSLPAIPPSADYPQNMITLWLQISGDDMDALLLGMADRLMRLRDSELGVYDLDHPLQREVHLVCLPLADMLELSKVATDLSDMSLRQVSGSEEDYQGIIKQLEEDQIRVVERLTGKKLQEPYDHDAMNGMINAIADKMSKNLPYKVKRTYFSGRLKKISSRFWKIIRKGLPFPHRTDQGKLVNDLVGMIVCFANTDDMLKALNLPENADLAALTSNKQYRKKLAKGMAGKILDSSRLDSWHIEFSKSPGIDFLNIEDEGIELKFFRNIRDEEHFREINERGDAAHWRYKAKYDIVLRQYMGLGGFEPEFKFFLKGRGKKPEKIYEGVYGEAAAKRLDWAVGGGSIYPVLHDRAAEDENAVRFKPDAVWETPIGRTGDTFDRVAMDTGPKLFLGVRIGPNRGKTDPAMQTNFSGSNIDPDKMLHLSIAAPLQDYPDIIFLVTRYLARIGGITSIETDTEKIDIKMHMREAVSADSIRDQISAIPLAKKENANGANAQAGPPMKEICLSLNGQDYQGAIAFLTGFLRSLDPKINLKVLHATVPPAEPIAAVAAPLEKTFIRLMEEHGRWRAMEGHNLTINIGLEIPEQMDDGKLYGRLEKALPLWSEFSSTLWDSDSPLNDEEKLNICLAAVQAVAFTEGAKLRKNGEEAFQHYFEVAMNLMKANCWDAEIVMAALLHDMLEDYGKHAAGDTLPDGKPRSDIVLWLTKKSTYLGVYMAPIDRFVSENVAAPQDVAETIGAARVKPESIATKAAAGLMARLHGYLSGSLKIYIEGTKEHKEFVQKAEASGTAGFISENGHRHVLVASKKDLERITLEDLKNKLAVDTEMIEQIFISMADGVYWWGAIVVKLSDRLHNLKTLEGLHTFNKAYNLRQTVILLALAHFALGVAKKRTVEKAGEQQPQVDDVQVLTTLIDEVQQEYNKQLKALSLVNEAEADAIRALSDNVAAKYQNMERFGERFVFDKNRSRQQYFEFIDKVAQYARIVSPRQDAETPSRTRGNGTVAGTGKKTRSKEKAIERRKAGHKNIQRGSANGKLRPQEGRIAQGVVAPAEFDRAINTLELRDIGGDPFDGLKTYRETVEGFIETVLENVNNIRAARIEFTSEHAIQLSNLLAMVKDGTHRIYSFPSLIQSRHDFILDAHNLPGTERRPGIFLATDLMEGLIAHSQPKLRDEYIGHVILCAVVGHERAIAIQKVLYPDHYPAIRPNSLRYWKGLILRKTDKGLLGMEIRSYIDTTLSAARGFSSLQLNLAHAMLLLFSSIYRGIHHVLILSVPFVLKKLPGIRQTVWHNRIQWLEQNTFHDRPGFSHAKRMANHIILWEGSDDAVWAALLSGINSQEEVREVLAHFKVRDELRISRIMELTGRAKLFQDLLPIPSTPPGLDFPQNLIKAWIQLGGDNLEGVLLAFADRLAQLESLEPGRWPMDSALQREVHLVCLPLADLLDLKNVYSDLNSASTGHIMQKSELTGDWRLRMVHDDVVVRYFDGMGTPVLSVFQSPYSRRPKEIYQHLNSELKKEWIAFVRHGDAFYPVPIDQVDVDTENCLIYPELWMKTFENKTSLQRLLDSLLDQQPLRAKVESDSKFINVDDRVNISIAVPLDVPGVLLQVTSYLTRVGAIINSDIKKNRVNAVLEFDLIARRRVSVEEVEREISNITVERSVHSSTRSTPSANVQIELQTLDFPGLTAMALAALYSLSPFINIEDFSATESTLNRRAWYDLSVMGDRRRLYHSMDGQPITIVIDALVPENIPLEDVSVRVKAAFEVWGKFSRLLWDSPMSEEDKLNVCLAAVQAVAGSGAKRRKNKEQTFQHYLTVAINLMEAQYWRAEVLIAGLFHDVYEDKGSSAGDWLNDPTKERTRMVDSVTKPESTPVYYPQSFIEQMAQSHGFDYQTASDDYREKLGRDLGMCEKLFYAFDELKNWWEPDTLKLADRLHNLKTIDGLPIVDQFYNLRQTLILLGLAQLALGKLHEASNQYLEIRRLVIGDPVTWQANLSFGTTQMESQTQQAINSLDSLISSVIQEMETQLARLENQNEAEVKNVRTMLTNLTSQFELIDKTGQTYKIAEDDAAAHAQFYEFMRAIVSTSEGHGWPIVISPTMDTNPQDTSAGESSAAPNDGLNRGPNPEMTGLPLIAPISGLMSGHSFLDQLSLPFLDSTQRLLLLGTSILIGMLIYRISHHLRRRTPSVINWWIGARHDLKERAAIALRRLAPALLLLTLIPDAHVQSSSALVLPLVGLTSLSMLPIRPNETFNWKDFYRMIAQLDKFSSSHPTGSYGEMQALVDYVRQGNPDIDPGKTFVWERVRAPWDMLRILGHVIEQSDSPTDRKAGMRNFLASLYDDYTSRLAVLRDQMSVNASYGMFYEIPDYGGPQPTAKYGQDAPFIPPEGKPSLGVEFTLHRGALREAVRSYLDSLRSQEELDRIFRCFYGVTTNDDLANEITSYAQAHPEQVRLSGNFSQDRVWGKELSIDRAPVKDDEPKEGWLMPLRGRLLPDPQTHNSSWHWTVPIDPSYKLGEQMMVEYRFAILVADLDGDGYVQIRFNDPSNSRLTNYENSVQNSAFLLKSKIATHKIPERGCFLYQCNLDAETPLGQKPVRYLKGRLAELKKRGFNAVLLSPGTLPPPGEEPYSTSYLTSGRYGSSAEMGDLLAAAKENGIQIYFDIVRHTDDRRMPYLDEDYFRAFRSGETWDQLGKDGVLSAWGGLLNHLNPDTLARRLWELRALGYPFGFNVRWDQYGTDSQYFAGVVSRMLGSKILAEWVEKSAQRLTQFRYADELRKLLKTAGHVTRSEIENVMSEILASAFGEQPMLIVNNHDFARTKNGHSGISDYGIGAADGAKVDQIRSRVMVFFIEALKHIDKVGLMVYSGDREAYPHSIGYRPEDGQHYAAFDESADAMTQASRHRQAFDRASRILGHVRDHGAAFAADAGNNDVDGVFTVSDEGQHLIVTNLSSVHSWAWVDINWDWMGVSLEEIASVVMSDDLNPANRREFRNGDLGSHHFYFDFDGYATPMFRIEYVGWDGRHFILTKGSDGSLGRQYVPTPVKIPAPSAVIDAPGDASISSIDQAVPLIAHFNLLPPLEIRQYLTDARENYSEWAVRNTLRARFWAGENTFVQSVMQATVTRILSLAGKVLFPRSSFTGFVGIIRNLWKESKDWDSLRTVFNGNSPIIVNLLNVKVESKDLTKYLSGMTSLNPRAAIVVLCDDPVALSMQQIVKNDISTNIYFVQRSSIETAAHLPEDVIPWESVRRTLSSRTTLSANQISTIHRVIQHANAIPLRLPDGFELEKLDLFIYSRYLDYIDTLNKFVSQFA